MERMATGEGSSDLRARVHRAVRAGSAPVAAVEVAQLVQAPTTTVRHHLDALERFGDIERVAPQPSGRGRPRVRYRTVVRREPGVQRYELLAGMLVAQMQEAPDGLMRAEQAGRAWGRSRAKSVASDADDAVISLVGVLDDVGFEPVRVDDDTVDLHNCPFRQTVAQHGDLVCHLHAGLISGVLEEWDAPVELTELKPFVAPGVCRAHVPRTASRLP